jgi:hypothetical protein
MKRRILAFLTFFLLILVVFPTISAMNIKVEKISREETIVPGINTPALLEIEVTNSGSSDSFKIDSVPGFFILNPVETEIGKGETKNVEIKIYARDDFSYTKPFYTLQYTITAGDSSSQKYETDIKVIDLKNVFEVSSDNIDPDATAVNVYIKNKENLNLNNVKAKISSGFFEFEKQFSLKPKEEKSFTVELNKEDFREMTAGFYTIKADIETGGQKIVSEGTLKFIEKTLITSSKKDYGFFILTNIITKTNDGNIIADSNTTIKKNVISRLFTSFSPEPDTVDREGFDIYYTWNKDVMPGQKLDIIIKTNWLIPFLIIFFVIVIVIFAKNYSKTNLIIKKKVTFVNAKGGEFALKVSLLVSAKKHTERISIIDRLPLMVKLHEKFAGEHPSKIDEKNRRLEWEISNLEKGEVRVMSYIIYSKVGVLGKFSLPTATAVYESEGKIEEAVSNRAFFISEQRKGQLEED